MKAKKLSLLEENILLKARIEELENSLFSKKKLNQIFENRTEPFVLLTADSDVLSAYGKMVNPYKK